MALEDIYEGLTDEQKRMARECKTPEEMLELTSKLGIKLSDEELDAVSGGMSWSDAWDGGGDGDGCDKYCLTLGA